MAMTWDEFLTRVVDDGIASVKSDVHLAEYPKRVAGSIRGFVSCRGKRYEDLGQLLVEANRKADLVRMDQESDKSRSYDIEDYWEARYVAIQIEWVCNTVSAAAAEQGRPPIVITTARGLMNAARILGVAGSAPS
jgi:hypothetical protein